MELPEIRTLIDAAVVAHPGEPVPRYGHPGWRALPWRDRRKWAAALIAAECWRDHCSAERVAADLRASMAAEDRAVLSRLRRTSAEVREALNASSSGWARGPSHAELVRRRREIPAPAKADR
jgi:hypothetical protein